MSFIITIEIPNIDKIQRAKPPKLLPVVLTRSEVQKALSYIDRVEILIISLFYETSIRLS